MERSEEDHVVNESPIPAVASAAATEKPRIWPMYLTLVSVGVACALVIVIVYEVTRPIIQRNKIELRKQAIFDVLPGVKKSAAFRLKKNSGRFEPTAVESEGEDLVFVGYDDQDELVGLALGAQGMGYQDTIRLLYGYSFEAQAIIGIRVLESLETPGLGDRIETDAEFLRNFEKLDVRLTANGDELANPIEFVKPGKKTAAWQIDGISGATISSQATAQMLGESAAKWIPRVRAREADFAFTEEEQ